MSRGVMQLSGALAFCLAVGFAVSAAAQKELLYEIDFDDRVVGQLPLVGDTPAPCHLVSLVPFGDPTVVAQFGALQQQPCAFGNGTTGYDQLLLDIDAYHFANRPPFQSFARFTCEFDLLVAALAGPFTVHCDGIGVHPIAFQANGTITTFTATGTLALGSDTFGARHHVRIDFDLRPSQKTVTFALDGTASPVLSAATGTSTPPALLRIRWNLEGTSATDAAAIDDLVVFGQGGSPATDLGGASAGGPDLSLSYGYVASLDLHLATPGWPVALLVSGATAPTPLFGGTLIPDLASGSLVTIVADANGSAWATVAYNTPLVTFYLQSATLVPATFDLLLSNAIRVTI